MQIDSRTGDPSGIAQEGDKKKEDAGEKVQYNCGGKYIYFC